MERREEQDCEWGHEVCVLVPLDQDSFSTVLPTSQDGELLSGRARPLMYVKRLGTCFTKSQNTTGQPQKKKSTVNADSSLVNNTYHYSIHSATT